MNKPFNEQLRTWQRIHKKKPKRKRDKRKEVLSERDIKELMGMYQPTYRRHRGAFRQR